MYGTVGRATIKPGSFDEVRALHEEWIRDFSPKQKGFIAAYLYRLDRNPDEILMVAVYQDKKSYMVTANDVEQDKWFQRLRDLMTADPEWMDGEIT